MPRLGSGRATFVGTAFRKTSPQGRTSTQGLPAHGGVHSRARGKYPKTRVPSGRRSARNKCRSGRAERTNRISEPQPTRCAIATGVCAGNPARSCAIIACQPALSRAESHLLSAACGRPKRAREVLGGDRAPSARASRTGAVGLGSPGQVLVGFTPSGVCVANGCRTLISVI
jgi:hypothetical protein